MSKSPNYWNVRNGWKPDIIVCHITEGSFNSAVSWLTNTESRASAHYVVGAKGEVENLVDLKNTAWCNGDINKPTNNYC
jgi:N-acetyl-anhydromuramyl-L-alanine amidase AmpD